MSFWETVVGNMLSGTTVAIVAAGLALLVSAQYSARQEEARASRQRDLAAAGELYRVYGDFFGVWKAWEYHSRPGPNKGPEASEARRSELIERAAAAEGTYEAFLVRMSLEYSLTHDQVAALWALRRAFKELRYAIRANKPLKWFRKAEISTPEGREYVAYKVLTTLVALMLTDTSGQKVWRRARTQRADTLKMVTGQERPYDIKRSSQAPAVKDWVIIAEMLSARARISVAPGRKASEIVPATRSSEERHL